MALLARCLLLVGASLVFLAGLVPGSDAGGCGCPPFWTGFQNNCYRYFATANITWTDAEMACRTFSVPCGTDPAVQSVGHLVSIHSQDEQDFVEGYYETVRTKRVLSRTWIGLHDQVTEDTHEWSDGSRVDFTNWTPGQPNNRNGVQDCVFLAKRAGYGWNDLMCTSLDLVESFMCKVPKW